MLMRIYDMKSDNKSTGTKKSAVTCEPHAHHATVLHGLQALDTQHSELLRNTAVSFLSNSSGTCPSSVVWAQWIETGHIRVANLQ